MHDVLAGAWASNCRRGGGSGGGGGGGEATIEGRTRKLRRNGAAGKPLPRVTVSANDVSQKSKRRRKKGEYALAVPAGLQHVTAAARRRTCHLGTPGGPVELDVTLAAGERLPLDVFCGRARK